MTRAEWLDRRVQRALIPAFDRLIEDALAKGATTDDLDQITAAWRAEIDEQLPPLRAWALQMLQAVPDHSPLLDEFGIPPATAP